MVFVRWLRFVTGCVKFSVYGAFYEQFLNYAANAGINIWDISDFESGVHAFVRASDYKKLKPFAQKAMVRIRVSEKHGIPFVRFRYRKRIGLLAGAAVFAVGLIVMSMFVWRIEINGTETLDEAFVAGKLCEYGIKRGVKKSDVNVRLIENKMRIAVPEIAWIAINLEGSAVTVEIEERTMPPEILPDDDMLSNIVAAKTGQITKMEVYAGKEVVRVGDTVKKGDLIVSGILEDKAGKTTFKHARAKVWAVTTGEIKTEIPLQKTVRVQSGKTKTKRSVEFFGYEIPLFFTKADESRFDIEKTKKDMDIFGMRFSVVDYAFTPIKEKTIKLNAHEAKEDAMKKLKELEAEEMRGANIIAREISSGYTDDDKNTFFIKAEYKYEVDIAEERQVLTET